MIFRNKKIFFSVFTSVYFLTASLQTHASNQKPISWEDDILKEFAIILGDPEHKKDKSLVKDYQRTENPLQHTKILSYPQEKSRSKINYGLVAHYYLKAKELKNSEVDKNIFALETFYTKFFNNSNIKKYGATFYVEAFVRDKKIKEMKYINFLSGEYYTVSNQEIIVNFADHLEQEINTINFCDKSNFNEQIKNAIEEFLKNKQ